MKASKIIEKLSQLIAIHGDLPVRYSSYEQSEERDCEVAMIAVYDGFGNKPAHNDKAVEFYIHSTADDDDAL